MQPLSGFGIIWNLVSNTQYHASYRIGLQPQPLESDDFNNTVCSRTVMFLFLQTCNLEQFKLTLVLQ